MPVLSACAQPFSFGIVGGEGLTQDFQNYDLPPNGGSPPGTTVSILGVSTPQRWIAGGTVEARLPLHLSVEVDALYHILRFREGNQSGQAQPQLFQYQHSVTWEFPVLLKYRFQLPLVKPFIAAGPRVQVLVRPELHEPIQSRIYSGVRSRGPSLEAQDRASVPLPALGA